MTPRTPEPPPALRTTDLLVLAVLGDGPQHGYALAREIDRRTKGRVRVRPGDLYRVLYRMHDGRLIEEVPAGARQGGDDRRTSYRITAFGRQVARDQARLLTEVCAPLLTNARGARSTP
jgi:DNA-binding PadR family transcriptional regulator